MSGVIATSGTDRSTIAIGMNVCSADGARLKTSATDDRGRRAGEQAEAGVA